MSATSKLTLSNRNLSLAFPIMLGEKSIAQIRSPISASSAVFLPVPQPSSKTDLQCRFAKVFLVTA